MKLTAVTFYKHGLGFFERRGHIAQDAALSFPRRAMDDVLKSLTVVPAPGVTVRGIAFETPPDRNEAARRPAITFSDTTPLSSLVAAFAGYPVRVEAVGHRVEGHLIGLEREDDTHLKRGVLVVSTPMGVALVPLATVTSIELVDPRARADLDHALALRQRDEQRATARISLSAAAEATATYIAPAPAWRVSYRVLVSEQATASADDARDVYVQGWGLFDNTLEEDLDGVQLTLTAGMPVSFRYDLHRPNTPERPVVQDEDRRVTAPMVFDGASAVDFMDDAVAVGAPARRAPMLAKAAMTAADVAQAAPVQASGESRGALFAYTIDAPVSVKRGESGMVPIAGFTARGARTLMYNRQKFPDHPAASVRFKVPDDTTLERGPAIVLDGGHYGGEAVVPFTSGGGEVILAYALELGIRVHSVTTQAQVTSKVSFRDRSVFIDTLLRTTTRYEVISTLATPVNLVIEHEREGADEFATTPFEEVRDTGRFRLAVPARGKALLPIVARRTLRRTQDVTGLTGQAVQDFLAAKLLDQATVAALEAILAKEAQLMQHEADRRGLEDGRKAARMRLDDARKSLQSLGPQDAALRQRFLDQMAQHDDALQALDRRDADLVRLMAGLKEEIDRAARALSRG